MTGPRSARPNFSRMRTQHSKRRAKAIGAGAVAVAAAAGATAYVLMGGDAPDPADATTVERPDAVALAAPGTVAPARSWSLSFSDDARITEVNVAAGDVVKEGDVLAVADDGDAAEAVAEAEDALDEAQESLDDAEDLSATCEDEEDAAESAAAAPAGDPAGVPAQSGTSTATTACTGSDPILTAQQSVNEAEQQLEEAEAALAGMTITAPADGTVMSVSASTGTVLAAGTALIELADLTTVTVTADFAEADAAALTPGQAVTVAFADEPVEAQIAAIDLVGTDTDGLVTYGVAVTLPDPPDDALAGSTATVTVVLDSAPDTLWVPAAALRDIDGDNATAEVVNADGTTETREVALGLRGDDGVDRGWYTGLEYADLPPVASDSGDGFGWRDGGITAGAAALFLAVASALFLTTRQRTRVALP